jgi:hypothetical protein
VERVSFAVVFGDSSLWLLEFRVGSDGEPFVGVRSIDLMHVRLAMEALIDMSWLGGKET